MSTPVSSNIDSQLINRFAGVDFQAKLSNMLVKVRSTGLVLDIFYITRETAPVIGSKWDALPAGYSVELFNASSGKDALLSISNMRKPMKIDQFQIRIDNGHQFVLLRHEDTPIGFTWARLDGSDDPGFDYKLEKDEAFLQGAFIDPRHRKRGFATHMRVQVYRILQKQGVKHFLSTTDMMNGPAKKFKAKLDARHFGCYFSMCWNDKKIVSFNTRSK